MRMFTAFVFYGKKFGNCVEEIDVKAETIPAARKEVRRILKDEYEPGYKKIVLEERFPGIIYF